MALYQCYDTTATATSTDPARDASLLMQSAWELTSNPPQQLPSTTDPLNMPSTLPATLLYNPLLLSPMPATPNTQTDSNPTNAQQQRKRGRASNNNNQNGTAKRKKAEADAAATLNTTTNVTHAENSGSTDPATKEELIALLKSFPIKIKNQQDQQLDDKEIDQITDKANLDDFGPMISCLNSLKAGVV